MRILLTADPELPVPPPLYGGIERLVDLWVRELKARGHKVGLIAHGDSTSPAHARYAWPGRRSQHAPDMLRNTLALAQASADFRPDVVHSSSRLAYLLPLLARGTPCVMTYHRFPGPRQIRWAARVGGRRLQFTGVSDHIRERGLLGGGNWHTVYNCLELGRYHYRASVDADAPLVFLSRIEEVKGAREAIAMAKAAGRRLVLAGPHSADAAATRYWQDHVAPHVDGRQVRYVGPVDDAAKDALLGNAAALLVPVQWDEPFGLVFVEAMACGTPVITTPRGALPEIVRPGVTGWLVNSHDEGVAALGRLDVLSRAACRADVEARFSASAAVKRFQRVYLEAMR